MRIPAKELDGAVVRVVSDFLRDELRITDALHLTNTAPDRLRRIHRNAAAAADDLSGDQPLRRQQLLRLLVNRITLHSGSLQVEIKRSDLDNLVAGISQDGAAHSDTGQERPDAVIDLTTLVHLKRRGVEAKLRGTRGSGRSRQTPDRPSLAPDIVEAILAGGQPVGLTANRLKRIGTLPLDWEHQHRSLSFPA